MGSSNFFFSLVGWTFIPDLATKHLLNFIYKSPIQIVSRPPPRTLESRKHHAVVFGLVITSYLMYTLVQSSRAMAPNFYEILGVPPNVDENGLKLAFRAFAKRYHPDRVGQQGEELFMYVRDAFEALKDPVVRFAYDRFGPDAVVWRQHCKTTREFLKQGLMASSGYHIVTGVALLFWSAIGRPSSVSFWRYILFASLFAAELSFILAPFPAAETRIVPPAEALTFLSSSSTAVEISTKTFLPTSYSVFQRIWPHRVPYQHILFLHQLFMFLSVALTRVVPQFISLLGKDGSDSRELDPLERAIWERIYGSIAIADREASLILHTILESVNPANTSKAYHDPTLASMRPLSRERTEEVLDMLTPEMHTMVVEANIKNQSKGPISRAWKAALSTPQKIFSNDKVDPASSPTKVKQEGPHTPKPFREKDVMAEEEVINRIGEASGSPRLQRTPSLTRVAGAAAESPTKVHSPARRGSFGPSAGEF